MPVDLVQAIDLFGRLSQQAGVERGDVTRQLLELVAAWIERTSGVTCSLSAAWSVWWAVYQRYDCLRQSGSAAADVAHVFGINPYDLTGDQLAAMHANIPRAQAQKRLAAGKFIFRTVQDCRDYSRLVLLATGDRMQADAALTQALAMYTDSKTGFDRFT